MSTTLIDLPDVRDGDYKCGAVNCILRYYELGQLDTAIVGNSPNVLERSLRTLGLNVLSGEMSFADLRYFTQTRRPVLAVLARHCVVISKVHQDKISFQCPTEGPATEKLVDFESRWQDRGKNGELFRQYGICAWV